MANITEQCAACSNTEFRILTKVGVLHSNTGLYRYECTVCGNIQTVQSKAQMLPEWSILLTVNCENR